MGAGRKTQNFILNESASFTSKQATNPVMTYRSLTKSHLGGVIFGCTNDTLNECLFKQLFGLPAQHFKYVKNVDPGLPLFLFNYNGRKLHGIFEAASSGQMNVNPYAWTTDGSERTQYPAQVQIRVRLRCQPLPEDRFKSIIIDNYYTQNHFWFELDHAQANKLISLLTPLAVASSSFAPQNTTKWRTIFQPLPFKHRNEEIEVSKPLALEVDLSHSPKGMSSPDVSVGLDANHHPLEDSVGKQVAQKEKDLIYTKQKELALEHSDLPLTGGEDTAVRDLHSGHEGTLEAEINSEEINEESLVNSFDCPAVISQLIQGMQELWAFKIEQTKKMGCLEKKLDEAERDIQQLKHRCMILECNDAELDLDESIFLVGGFDGVSWSSALDSYSPKHDVMKSLKPMNAIRGYASVAWLYGELYVFGGGNGGENSHLWYDTVESYDPANNNWSQRPSLNVKRGSLAGATLNDKIFAVGGGDGSNSFADVEMFDVNIGRWISTQSMLHRRYALAAAELNGALYAVGGFDGTHYLNAVERFDPREHCWTRIGSMNTKRGSHSMAVLNEKIYVMGGWDESSMVSSTEIYDPRLGSWIVGESMNQSRGYSAAAVLKDSIYVIGGLLDWGDDDGQRHIVEPVERYVEGQGWQEITNLRAIGKRCFFSAFVL